MENATELQKRPYHSSSIQMKDAMNEKNVENYLRGDGIIIF